MGKLFKSRELLSRYPWLDTVRMNFLEVVCNDGLGFFDRSYRIIKIFAPGAQKLLEENGDRKPFIWSIYHGRMVGALGLKPRSRMTILVSQSRDGEMIARGAKGMGFSIARGSSKQGAVRGALELVEAVKQGQDLAFMVDGPRGPKFQIKPGIIRMAEMLDIPIMPFVCSARSTWWMPSWDSFMAPWWSTPIVYIFGEPLHVPKGCSDEEQERLLAELQARMEHCRKAADAIWPQSI